jgi:PAS domain S-box-containing protein
LARPPWRRRRPGRCGRRLRIEQTGRQGRILKPSARSVAGDRPKLELVVVAATGVPTAAPLPGASLADSPRASIAVPREANLPAAEAQSISDLEIFSDIAVEALEQMRLGFVALDHDLRVTYANPAARALVGLSLAEFVGRRPWEQFPQIVGTQHQMFKSSEGITFDYEDQIGTGARWVGVFACPIQSGTVVFLRDLSERKRAEESVRRTVALRHGLLDPDRDAFLLCSAVRDDEGGAIVDFKVDFANGVAGAFMSRTPDALMGALASAMTPDWAANLGQRSFLDLCCEVVETGEAWADDAVVFAVPGLGGAGGHGTLGIQIARYNDGFFATWRDVTESRRLIGERDRLVAVVEQSLDGIVITDAESIVTYANPAYLASSGLALGDIVGRPAGAVALAVAGPEAFAAFAKAGVETAPWLQEIEQKRPDGTTGRLEVSLTHAVGSGGSAAGYVVVIRDVTELREAEAEVLLQALVRAALVDSFHSISPEASLEQASQAICDQLVTLASVDVAMIQIFLGGEDVQVLAQSAPPGYPLMAGTHLPPARAATVVEQAAVGPWARFAERGVDDGGPRAAAADEGLKALAYGPIVHGDTVVGTLVLGTFDERFARMVVEKMPGIASFGVASSALLAERMYRRRETAGLKQRVGGILAARAFHPVFQPIVDLEGGEVVGYEALTRFDSGQRPDLCFADAWSVGLGAEMELATLAAAVEAGKLLPPGVWLNLNVSPRLLADPERLRPILWEAERPLVLEVTEHEVIEDYDVVRAAIRALGRDMRVAVDDAGAIDLRPDFVKLDFSLVRGVNLNLGRQAMVVGMRHFSRTAGCRLIAEGVETIEEARTLTSLGVEFGQGYLFGRPEPVETWATARIEGEGPAAWQQGDRPTPRT